MVGGLGGEEDPPVNAGQVPIVLVLQIAGVRKAQHHQGQQVFARMQLLRHPKLRRELAILGKAGGLAVDPAVEGGFHPVEAQVKLLAFKALRQMEADAVAARRVVLRGKGRVRLVLSVGQGAD